jgi:hypothetical protein
VRGQAASGELAPILIAVTVATVLAIRGATMLNVVFVGGLVYVAVLLTASATG